MINKQDNYISDSYKNFILKLVTSRALTATFFEYTTSEYMTKNSYNTSAYVTVLI